MFTFDLKFLSQDDVINIKNGDLKTSKYESKKKQEESIYDIGKRSYCEKRGGLWRAARPRQIRELETKFRERNIVFCDWTSDTHVTIVFSCGAIAYLTVDSNTLDISQILFDRYCISKLSGQTVSTVVFSNSLVLFIYVDQTATLITYGVLPPCKNVPCRIADKDPHVQIVQLAGPARRSERHVSWSESGPGSYVLVWNAICSNPVPWSPVGEDRANLHLYHINGTHMKLVNYLQLENETLCAELSKIHNNVVHIVEQITIQKTGIYLEWTTYEMLISEEGANKLSIPGEVLQTNLPAPARVSRLSPSEVHLFVGCIDGSLHIVHQRAGLTQSTRAMFIATDVRWAGDVLITGEDRGRLQCFDRALASLHHHTKCLDLAVHFRESRRMSVLTARAFQGGALLLLYFAGGPLALLRIAHPKLPAAYIRTDRLSRAVALLRALDWATEGERCLLALHELIQAALCRGMRPESEAVAQAALGAYFQNKANDGAAAQRFAPSVHDLARKFFHHLLRRGRLDKALSLAVELGACDLFADARWAAARAGHRALADEAHALATATANATAAADSRSTAPYSHSARSHDSSCSGSCSQCSTSSSRTASDDETNSNRSERMKAPPLPRIPPLPDRTTIMPVSILASEPTSTNSIRPLHQYLERDLTIWSTDVINDPSVPQKKCHIDWNVRTQGRYNKSSSVTDHPAKWMNRSTVVDITRPHEFGRVYQTELREPTTSSAYAASMYRYRDGVTATYDRSINDRANARVTGERNKVKFSDTVTVAVVPENTSTAEHPQRAEILPRACISSYSAAPTGTSLDYVEV